MEIFLFCLQCRSLKCLLLLVVRYGFRSPPHLELKARPKLGEREVTLAHVTDWIERRLDQEFQVQTEKKKVFYDPTLLYIIHR